MSYHPLSTVSPRESHRLLFFWLTAVAGSLMGCDDYDPTGAADSSRTAGRSDFQSEAAGGGLPGSGSGRSAGGNGAGLDPDAIPAPMGPGSTSGEAGSPGAGLARLIEEGDIVELVGKTLYVLNEFRGLQVVDLSDPDAPVLLSSVPVLGKPEDLYVRGTHVLALVSDHRRYTPCASCAGGAAFFRGSALASIDVSNPRAAVLAAQADIPGTIGDSRIVGDVLYVVAHQYTFGGGRFQDDGKNATTVLSFPIAAPAALVEKGRLELPREGWENHVHFTEGLLFVASSGFGSWTAEGTCAVRMAPMTGGGGSGAEPGSSGQSGGSTMGGSAPAMPVPTPPPSGEVPVAGEPCSRIVVIDISAPDGALAGAGAHVDLPGRVIDRWSMDHHAGVLRVVTAPGFGVGAPRLTTFRAPSAAALTPLGPGIHVPVPRPEELKAVRFDGTRAFVVTFQRTDPLFVLDLSDPEGPRTVGELETPGWVDHIEPRGDRLLAIGHDQRMDGTTGRGQWLLSASIYDVSDLTQPRLMSRELFGEGAGTIPDERNNWHKVFRIFDAQKLIVMPYRVSLPPAPDRPWANRIEGRVQLVDFDLPSGVLTRRGAVAHDADIERALLDQDQLVAISPRRVQLVDVANRDQPRARGGIDLSRDVREVVTVGADAVAAVPTEEGGLRLELLPAADVNASQAAASLPLPLADARLFAAGAFVYVLGRPVATGVAPEPGYPGGSGGDLRLHVVEVAAGTLRPRGTLPLPPTAWVGTPGTRFGGVPMPAALAGPSTLVVTLARQACSGGGGVGGSPPVGGATPPPTVTPVPPPARGGMEMPAPSAPPDAAGATPVDAGAAPAGPDAGAPPDGAADAGTADAAADADGGAPAAAPGSGVALPTLTGEAEPSPLTVVTRAQTSCPAHEADFVVIDLRNPDAPVIASQFLIPEASDVVGAALIGTQLYVDHFEQVPGLDALNRVIVAGIRYFVTRVDLQDPARPALGPKINVPGIFVGERSQDRTWFTLEPRRDANGREEVVLHALYQPTGQNRAYLEGSLPLSDDLQASLLFSDRAAYGAFAGQLVTLDLANPKAPVVAGRQDVPGVLPGSGGGAVGVGVSGPAGGGRPVTFSTGWAGVRGLAAGTLVLGTDSGALTYDLGDPLRPAVQTFVRGAGSSVWLHPSPTDGSVLLPAGRHPLHRTRPDRAAQTWR